MSGAFYIQVLDLGAGATLVCAVVALWRRDLRAIVTVLSFQGVALSCVAAALAAHTRDAGLAVTAGLVLLAKGIVVPSLLRRVLRGDPGSRESAPLANVPASLVAVALLIVVAYLASAKVTALSSSDATRLVPIGVATLLIGFFMLVTRRKAVSQIVGLLLVDNGVALTAFLLTAGLPLMVELGASLDVLLVVVVLQLLVATMRTRFGRFDLDQLRELHD